MLLLFVINGCDIYDIFSGGGTNFAPDSFQISIQRTHNSLQGQRESVEITLDNNTIDEFLLGGFDLMITYDASALTFQSVEQGQFLTNCGWEYFTVRHEIIEADSTNIYAVRVVSIADIYPPIQRPVCFTPTDSSTNQLVVLNFLVTNDRAYECSYSPIQFFWGDCGDNMMSDYSGNQLFVSRFIYNKLDTGTVDYFRNLAEESIFPSIAGFNSSCDSEVEAYSGNVIRKIDFVNGGIDIVCADSIDTRGCSRGDLNNNNVQFEIYDVILYSNYFVYGMQVFSVNIDCQIEASDSNGDDLTLTLADFVYSIRVLVGDTLPFGEPSNINATFQHDNAGKISVVDSIQIAAAHIVVEGEVTPTLLADNMTMGSAFDGSNTRIIVYSLENNNFIGDMVNVGSNTILSIDAADYLGNQVILTEVN